jgi:hypothetical protein
MPKTRPAPGCARAVSTRAFRPNRSARNRRAQILQRRDFASVTTTSSETGLSAV